MKLFIAGISGLLGLSLAWKFRERFSVSGCYLSSPVSIGDIETSRLDVTHFQAVEEILSEMRPDVIVNTVALTNVDECEGDPGLAHKLNVKSAQHLATVASTLGSQFVHISTDQLYDGASPWKSEADPPAPMNIYARTKWLAEQAVLEACPNALIVRTNFFGWGTSVRASFSDWILRGLEQQRELTMFSDVFFTPILMNQLIDVITELISIKSRGIFHVAGGERLSKYAFAVQIADEFGYPTHGILATSVQEFPFKAARPMDMSLSSKKTEICLGTQMPSVAEGLEQLHSLQKDGWQQDLENAIVR